MAVETDIALRDGSTVHVRHVEPSDTDALAAFYGGLSEESRVFRFFSAAADLRAAASRSAEARDGRGLVATIDGRDHIVGHAEYIRFGRMATPGPELLAGAVSDPRFGPLVVVAAGGAAAELMRDVQVRLASVGPRAASDMVRGLRIRPLLEGHRGAEPVDMSAVEDLVIRIGALAVAHPQLAELECNPVIASASGVAVVDARVRLGPSPERRPLGALDR
jgi:ATP-grasp domain